MRASQLPGLDAMFAASLNTLKKRTSQLLKGDDAQRTEDAHDGFGLGGDTEYVSPTAPAGQLIIRYQLQNDTAADREGAAFLLPLGPTDCTVTGSLIRAHFPLPGSFHFRFKAPTSDGSFGGFIWVDLANDDEFAPVFRGEIFMKALKLPEGAAARVHASVSGSALAASPLPASAQVRGSALHSQVPMESATFEASIPRLKPTESLASSPSNTPSAPMSDLMEVGMGSDSPALLSQSPLSSPGRSMQVPVPAQNQW